MTLPKLSPTKRLELIRILVHSVGDTISVTEAISAIASLFPGDPGKRLNPATLPELLHLVSVPRPRPRRISAARRAPRH